MAGILQGCIDLEMETRRCAMLGKRFSLVSTEKKVKNTNKINQDSARKGETSG